MSARKHRGDDLIVLLNTLIHCHVEASKHNGDQPVLVCNISTVILCSIKSSLQGLKARQEQPRGCRESMPCGLEDRWPVVADANSNDLGPVSRIPIA